MPNANKLLGAALFYATTFKVRVFPVKPKAKDPLTAHGFKDATTDVKIINQWWQKHPRANVGLVTGTSFWVLDVDPRNGGDDSLMQLVAEYGPLPETIQQTTGSGGRHYLFLAPPGEPKIGCITGLWPGVDVKGVGGYIVAPPSIHPNGRAYIWDGMTPITEQHIASAPAWLLATLRAHKKNGGGKAVPEKIKKGVQHETLFRLGCSLRAKGLEEAEIFGALREVNKNRCEEPGLEANIKKLAASICEQYPAGITHVPAPEPKPPEPPPEPLIHPNGALPGETQEDRLCAVIETFQHWLHFPDARPLVTLLGAIAANQLEGDPVWLLLIGPPASGKTEMLDSVLGLPRIFSAGVLTEGALLSGVSRRDKTKEATGGLLRVIDRFGFIICKDFTSVLSMGREARTPLLAALREIADGAWTRHVGTDGGRPLSWSGKCALIGGCTPIIDQHHAVMAAMGERFLLCRLPDVDSKVQACRALRHVGKETPMRKALRSSVSALFSGLKLEPCALTEEEENRLAGIATLVAHCRSAVERDNYRREVELVPGSERPARLVVSLARLYQGLQIIGTPLEERWRLIDSVALDCIPAVRRLALRRLHDSAVPLDTTAIAVAIDYPTNTTRRALEDLTAHKVVDREAKGVGRADLWRLSTFASILLSDAGVTFPNKSE